MLDPIEEAKAEFECWKTVSRRNEKEWLKTLFKQGALEKRTNRGPFWSQPFCTSVRTTFFIKRNTLKAVLLLHCLTHTHMNSKYLRSYQINRYLSFVLLSLPENSAWVWFLLISEKMPNLKYLSQAKSFYVCKCLN